MARTSKRTTKSNGRQRGKDAALSVRSAAAEATIPANDQQSSEQRRDITTRSVAVRAGSFNEAERSFEAVLTTENPVPVFDWQSWRTVDEVLLAEGGTWPTRMPMLDTHSRFSVEDVMGSMVVASRDGGNTVVRASFASGDDRAERSMLKVRDKHITDVSLGYRVIKFTDIPAGQSGVVNGRTFTAGPDRALRVTTQWEAVEGSLVPIGADRAAKIRVTPARQEFPKMNQQLRAYLQSIGLRADATDAEAWAFMSTITAEQQRHASTLFTPAGTTAAANNATGAQPAADTASQRQSATTPATNGATPPADADAARAEGQRLERERQSGIRSLARANTPQTVIDRCINEGLTVERSAMLILEAERGATPGAVNGTIGINTGAGRGDASEQLHALSASLALRAGLRADRLPTPRGMTTEQQRAHRERIGNMAADLGDVSLLDVMRMAMIAEGRSVPHHRSGVLELARAATSTGGLSNVFTTSMNAVLLQAYQEAPDTAAAWTNQVEVADFKANDRILPSKGGGLKKLGRGGTAKDLAYGDTKESYRVARYAGKLTADEQDVIDDNIGFLQTVTRDMGLAAAELRPRLVYAILLRNAALDADGVTLFHSSHSNTATNALATSGSLAAAIIGMAKQTQDGRVLNLMPKFLLVPQDLFETAMNQLESPTIVLSGNTDVRAGVKNVLANFGITPIMDARLGVAGVTDPSNETAYAGSATNWFLAADPVQGKTIEVGVLRGTGGRPQVRSYVLSQGQWGMGWDVNLDIGAKALDYRGLYRGNT